MSIFGWGAFAQESVQAVLFLCYFCATRTNALQVYGSRNEGVHPSR